MIDRRALLVSALATAASRSALAQPAVARVAWLSPSSAADSSVFFEELREGLRESGYVQPRNLEGIAGGVLFDPADRFREVYRWRSEPSVGGRGR